jgi:small-conductance mechanosensitive channel
MNAQKAEIDNYATTLLGFRDQIDSINSISALYAFPADSVETMRYYKKLVVIVKEIGPPDAALDFSLASIEDLQTRVDEHVYELKTYIERVEKFRVSLTQNGLKKEVPGLLAPALNSRPLSEIFRFSFEKEKMALGFYTKDNKGRIILLLLLIASATIFLYQLKKKANEINRNSTESQLVLHRPFFSAVIIVISIFQFLFLHPPFIFSYTLWLVAVICLSFLFKGLLAPYWMRFWLIIVVLFLLAGANNMVLQASRPERWYMLLFSGLGAGYGIFVLLSGHRHDLKEKRILYFIAFMVTFEIGAAIANVTGRFNIAKTLLVSGYIGLVIAILFLWTLRLMNQALSITSKVYKHPEKKLFYFNFDKIGEKVPLFFYVLLVLGWGLLVGKNFYEFQQISEAFNGFLNKQRTVGDYSFTVNGVFVFFIILAVSVLLSKIISFFAADPVVNSGSDNERKRIGLGSWILLIRIFIISMGLFLAFAAAGIPLDRITIILGALGVGIGLGLQGLVNNLVSGLIIAFEKPVNVGDTIEVSGKPGIMKSIGFRSSVVTLSNGASLIIPNGDLLSQHLINWSMGRGLKRISLVIQVRYDTNLETAIQLVYQEIQKDKRIVSKPAPAVAPVAFGDSAITIEIQYWIRQADIAAMDIHGKLILHITQAFKAEGIEIAYPQQELHIKGFLDTKFDDKT